VADGVADDAGTGSVIGGGGDSGSGNGAASELRASDGAVDAPGPDDQPIAVTGAELLRDCSIQIATPSTTVDSTAEPIANGSRRRPGARASSPGRASPRRLRVAAPGSSATVIARPFDSTSARDGRHASPFVTR